MTDGFAALSFVVNTDGRVEDVRKIEYSHPAFYAHTREAVKRWVFSPATRDGEQIAVECEYRLNYLLTGGGEIPDKYAD